MITREVIDRLRRARTQLPHATWTEICNAVEKLRGRITDASLAGVLGRITNRDISWILKEALESSNATTWEELSASILTLDAVADHEPRLLEVIWTGPASRRFSPRRTDQVLYDLLAAARVRALVVTFAAHKVERLVRELHKAHSRGVRVTLLFETEDGSGGQLTRDAISAFTALPLDSIEVLHWPRHARDTNAAGRPGKLHAKCAVIDDTVVIGSANLTEDAFGRNIELGVMMRDSGIADAIHDHFRDLHVIGKLERFSVGDLATSQTAKQRR